MVTNGVEIYQDKLTFADIRRRIDQCYFPYHDALHDLIEATHLKFGACLLLDCHSMPSTSVKDPSLAQTDIILGDRFGTSCAEWITDYIHDILIKEGFAVRRNRPYAGGFTTSHYSQPDQKIHTIQIELSRKLYMDEDTITRRANIHPLKKRLTRLIETLSALDPNSL